MVESENAVQIALTCFVLTLRAVYGYAWIFFFWKMEISRRALSLFLFHFFFGVGGVQFKTCPFILSVESENTGQIVLTFYWPYARYTGTRGFFLNPEISGLALSFILVQFYFFFSIWVLVPLFFSVESENVIQIALTSLWTIRNGAFDAPTVYILTWPHFTVSVLTFNCIQRQYLSF